MFHFGSLNNVHSIFCVFELKTGLSAWKADTVEIQDFCLTTAIFYEAVSHSAAVTRSNGVCLSPKIKHNRRFDNAPKKQRSAEQRAWPRLAQCKVLGEAHQQHHCLLRTRGDYQGQRWRHVIVNCSTVEAQCSVSPSSASGLGSVGNVRANLRCWSGGSISGGSM